MDQAPTRRRTRARLYVAGVSAVVALALAGVWSQRMRIAGDYVDAELARRGVRARYAITRFGIGGQRLEHVRIGDPVRPDLTAEVADLRIAMGWNGPYLAAVSARGVRLRGRLVDGRVTLGAVDRLLPPPGGAPFALPDLTVALADAAMRLETPAGTVGIAVDGRGRLSDGFAGRLGVDAPRLALGGCRITGAHGMLNVAIADRRPALDGPVGAAAAACAGGLTLLRPAAAVDVALGTALDRWTGGAMLRVAAVRAGTATLATVAGRIGFAGSARGTAGAATLAAARVAGAGLRAGPATFDGRYRLGDGVRVAGRMAVRDAAADAGAAQAIRAAAGVGAGTPIAPVVRAATDALAAAATRFDARADVDFLSSRAGSRLRLAEVAAVSASGARATVRQGAGVGMDWPGGAVRIDGRVAIAGGGLPTIDAVLDQRGAGGPVSGTARVAAYRVGGGALSLAPVRFRAGAGATRIDTVATIDGPVASGRVTRLTLPVVARLARGGAFVVNAGCVPVRFDALALSGLAVGATRMRLCPTGDAMLAGGAGSDVRGGGRIAGPVIAGTLGGARLRVAADALRFDLGRTDFVADGMRIVLGAAESATVLEAGRFAGDFRTGGAGGRFAGLSARIGTVPLRIGDGAGRWRLTGGTLDVADGTLTVSDSAAAARFRPLVSRDAALTLADGRIVATGRLAEPGTGALVTAVAIRHDLSSGAGTARLEVPGITFGEGLQPERLTPLTLGVVANVRGTVAGRGDIAWDRRGVTSTGRFGTESLDLAAAFGPVSGIATTVTFDDLLALRTLPGQVATVREINPGIAVRDGVVRYRLLPEQRVAVEGGRWPFSAGVLTLEPTLLDFAGARTRRMTFRVTGMDAAQFVEQFDFKNVAVTGTFDGVMPMLFDDRGGRIVGGRLGVREGGGTLAYVGEVSNAKLGMFGSLAFDALKRMRYRSLAILLDGALDGELVSKVVFDGTNQTPREAIRKNGLLSQFSNLPFRFNITVRAPFRGLLNSARSLNDPRGLIEQAMPPAGPPLPGSAPLQPKAPVQPKESETVR